MITDISSIQKKSILFSLIIGVIYYLISIYPKYFLWLFLLTMLLVLAYSFYHFQLKFSKESLHEDVKFLILPILFNFGASIFINNSIFQLSLRLVFVLFTMTATYFLFTALKKVQNLEERAAIMQRNIVISLSFFSLFLSISALFRSYVSLTTSRYSSIAFVVLVIAVSAIFYGISYFLAWENGINARKYYIYNLVGTFLAAEATIFGTIWIINYPTFSLQEKANLGGFPMPALVLTIIFYLIWGITSHKMDKSLTKRVLSEYIVIGSIFLLVIFITAKWLPIF